MSGQIINRKTVHRLGFVSWHFFRPLDAAGKKRFQYVIHFSPDQIERGGRAYLAQALRRARSEMRIQIKKMKGMA